jgi:hypothetical protein
MAQCHGVFHLTRKLTGASASICNGAPVFSSSALHPASSHRCDTAETTQFATICLWIGCRPRVSDASPGDYSSHRSTEPRSAGWGSLLSSPVFRIRWSAFGSGRITVWRDKQWFPSRCLYHSERLDQRRQVHVGPVAAIFTVQGEVCGRGGPDPRWCRRGCASCLLADVSHSSAPRCWL